MRRTNRMRIAGTALLALALTATAAQKKRYVITEYGAVGDGKTLNTMAIQAVIHRCAWSGGGVVVVPKGTFLSGALFFKQINKRL